MGIEIDSSGRVAPGLHGAAMARVRPPWESHGPTCEAADSSQWSFDPFHGCVYVAPKARCNSVGCYITTGDKWTMEGVRQEELERRFPDALKANQARVVVRRNTLLSENHGDRVKPDDGLESAKNLDT